MVDYNAELLNYQDLGTSFFHLDRNDPTLGFSFDASRIFGHIYPAVSPFWQDLTAPVNNKSPTDSHDLILRLCLGSHLARHLRHQLEDHKGYSSTVGISTNKLLSKLIGNVNKPKGQTVLLPPYTSDDKEISNVNQFIDNHDIGKIPGIGFKAAQKIRDYVLGQPAAFSTALVYGGTKENVKVRDVRMLDGMGPELLGRLLGGPGTPRDLGEKVWDLMNGVENAEVAQAKEVPRQISIVGHYFSVGQFFLLTTKLGGQLHEA